MPRDGNGTYNLPNPAVITNTVIESADENETRNDIATALSQSFSRDGQTIATGNFNMGTKRVRNMADPIAPQDAATKAYVDGAIVWKVVADTAVTVTRFIDVTWAAGSYRALLVYVLGVKPVSGGGGVNLLARARRGGGYLSGSTDYTSLLLSTSSAGPVASDQEADAWILTTDGTSSAFDSVTATLSLDPGFTATEPTLTGNVKSSGNTLGRLQHIVTCALPIEGQIDGIRLLWGENVDFAAVGRVVVLGAKPAIADINPISPNDLPAVALARILQFAVSDETTAVEEGETKISLRAPYPMTVQSVRASLNSACATGTFTVDINVNGSSILATKLTIDATEVTSTSAGVQFVLSETAIPDDALITVDVDDEGDGTATGLKVAIIGEAVAAPGEFNILFSEEFG